MVYLLNPLESISNPYNSFQTPPIQIFHLTLIAHPWLSKSKIRLGLYLNLASSTQSAYHSRQSTLYTREHDISWIFYYIHHKITNEMTRAMLRVHTFRFLLAPIIHKTLDFFYYPGRMA